MAVPIAKIIQFNPAGGTVKVNLQFDTLLVCTYTILLRETGSNTTVMAQTGDNTNDQGDIFPLPLPVASNNGRILWAIVTIIDQTGSGGHYTITMEIIQDGRVIGSVTTTERSITTNIGNEILIAKLTC